MCKIHFAPIISEDTRNREYDLETKGTKLHLFYYRPCRRIPSIFLSEFEKS